MGTRKSARLAAVCIGAATFVAAVPVLCAELQQVGSQEAADMEDAFETTAQQTIPGYHNVIELNTLFQMALGKNVIEDAADDKVVRLKNGMLTFVCDPADVTDSINGILNLKKVCDENDTQLLYIQAPQKISKFDPELPAGVQDYGNEIADSFLQGIDGKIPYIDLREKIYDAGINQYDLFFKTDHHWTPEGAFWCWGKVAQTLKSDYGFAFDDKITNMDSYTVKTYPDWFLGSQGKRTGSLYAGADDITEYIPKFETDFTYASPSFAAPRTGPFSQSLLFPERVAQRDWFGGNPYTLYAGGDYGIATITNHLNPEGKHIVLLRESFSCALTPFLALSCGELTTIDLRYFDGDLMSILRELEPDLVMSLYCVSSISNQDLFSFQQADT